MKLPAVAITAAFSGGIVLGLQVFHPGQAASYKFLALAFVCAAFFLFAGFILAFLGRLFPAAAASMLSWLAAGFLAACSAQQPLPADHVLSMLAANQLELRTPLRWHARLRDEPARVPWGYGYDLELSAVEFEGRTLATRGGMRLAFTPKPDDTQIPEAHAGDEISVLTQAKLPQIYKDDGAFDRRGYLAQQNIHLIATLRAPELLERVAIATPTMSTRLARWRKLLRDEVDFLFGGTPQVAGILRAMLLGDRSFIDRGESVDFQKTGVFHVLVVAGLHVGALAVFLFWLGRKLRLPHGWATLLMLVLLFSYVAVVEQRPPVLRAAVTTAIVVMGSFFYRRLELLNSAALAALLLLIARPLALRDTSFQLSFVAIGCIAGLAMPWLERTVQPYVRALRGWRDVTRDAAHERYRAQFRIDLRDLCAYVFSRMRGRVARDLEDLLVAGIGLSFRVWELFVLTLVLQFGMLPLMARDFHRIPLAGAIANLVVVPLTVVIVPLGFFAVGAGLLLPALGKILAVPLGWLALAELHFVQWFAHFSRASYRIPGPPPWLILSFFIAAVLLAAALRMRLPAGKWFAPAAGGLLMATSLLVAGYPFSPKRSPGHLEVTILDVGQGDSLFVVSPAGRTMLIDGGGAFQGFPDREEHLGPDPGEDAVSPYLWSRGFKKLDVVALTHAHQDHIGGLAAILENFPVGRLWIGREIASPALARLEEIAHRKNISIEHEIKGPAFSWDGADGAFLWPEISPSEAVSSAKNNDSLVLRLHYGERSILLPGDAEKQAEYSILAENSADALRADVLKVGHHGSKNSTMPEFLAAIHPSVAIISAGLDNPYGHPSPELLARLEQAGVRVLRTDRDGAVHILTDGKRIEVSCYVACPEEHAGMSSGQAQFPDHQQDNEKK